MASACPVYKNMKTWSYKKELQQKRPVIDVRADFVWACVIQR